MNPKDYEKNVLVTESKDLGIVKDRIDTKMVRLLHAALGLSSELAELEDAVNKDEVVKNGVDFVNIVEEVSDLMWYTGIAINALGLDATSILECSTEDVADYKQHFKQEDGFDLETVISGMVWSTGEFNDLIKKHLMYGKEFNSDKAAERLKALSYSMNAACYISGKTPEEAREININKLKARYGEKFSEAAALERNLKLERKVLEGEKV